jgi:hypothetical protein
VAVILVLLTWQGCRVYAEEPNQGLPASISEHLKWADAECDKAIDHSLRPVEEIFSRAKRNAPALAEELLGFSSKWALILDYLPGTGSGRHAEFVRAKLAEHLFSPEQLNQAIDKAVRSYLNQVKDIESQMLVKIRLDMEDLPDGTLAKPTDEKALQAAFDRSLALVRRQVAHDLKKDVGALAAGEVASEISGRITLRVLRHLAMRVGLSGPLLGAGAGSSWLTSGISLAGSLVVDWLVFEIVDWWADPKGKLTAAMCEELARLRRLLIRGAGSKRGLRGELKALARRRSALRRAAILDAMSSSKE